MDIPESLRNAMNVSSRTPLEEAQRFLCRYWADGDVPDAISAQLNETISYNPSSVIQGLLAIELLLKTSLPDEALLNMVLWDANHPLDEPSEKSAKLWLKEVTEFVRAVLGDQQPL
jgi:hypothetical protein